MLPLPHNILPCLDPFASVFSRWVRSQADRIAQMPARSDEHVALKAPVEGDQDESYETKIAGDV